MYYNVSKIQEGLLFKISLYIYIYIDIVLKFHIHPIYSGLYLYIYSMEQIEITIFFVCSALKKIYFLFFSVLRIQDVNSKPQYMI